MKRLLYIFVVMMLLHSARTLATTISGTLSVCSSASTTLTIDTIGGTWNSANTAIATVIPGTGVVTGVAAGTAVISYTLTDTVYTTVVTVNVQPAAIAGTGVMCEGQFRTLISTPVGGTWTSSAPAIANVVSNGKVTGISGGTATITYSASAGCYVTYVVTINPVPAVIVSDSGAICEGKKLTLSTTPAGGEWLSANPAVASIDAVTGVVTAVDAGLTSQYLVSISYTMPTGCRRTTQITLNAQPGPIFGDIELCLGNRTTMVSGPEKCKWSSSNPAVASINAKTGLLRSYALGTTDISYTNDSGCKTTVVVTVVPHTADCPVAVQPVDDIKQIGITIYPNPNTGNFVLNTPGAGTFSIISLDGRRMAEFDINSKTTTIVTDGMPAGLYTGRFSAADGYSLYTILSIQH
jgi:uncharacterized protein YjdB